MAASTRVKTSLHLHSYSRYFTHYVSAENFKLISVVYGPGEFY